MAASGRRRTRPPPTAHPTGAFDGRVSPDGATLAFVAHEGGSLELWHQPTAESPAWLPDGTGVVLASDAGAKSGLHSLSRDGRLTPLTTGPGWLPRVLKGAPGSP